MTREEVANLEDVDHDAPGTEVRCTTLDTLVHMSVSSGNVNRRVVCFVTWGAKEFLIIEDASGASLGRGGSGSGLRGTPQIEPMPPQP